MCLSFSFIPIMQKGAGSSLISSFWELERNWKAPAVCAEWFGWPVAKIEMEKHKKVHFVKHLLYICITFDTKRYIDNISISIYFIWRNKFKRIGLKARVLIESPLFGNHICPKLSRVPSFLQAHFKLNQHSQGPSLLMWRSRKWRSDWCRKGSCPSGVAAATARCWSVLTWRWRKEKV